ncbi:hypothetical protein ABEY82_02500 [Priestia megaterium]
MKAKEAVHDQVATTNQHLESLSILLKILPGQKNCASTPILRLYTEGLTINDTNKYLIIDLPEEAAINQFENLIYKIQLKDSTDY